ncbi:MAG: hypothetical protein F6K58_32645 [Symploca sp. SIO2E9]|nr:hypothetical protein [Symploca sp. SIO2E9]
MSQYRKKHLEEQKKNHEQELDNISINMGFYNPASTEYIELDRKHKLICSKLEEIENELSSYEQSSLTNNQRVISFDRKLPKIDFGRPKQKIDKIITQFGRQGGSAFLLIENTTVTRGDLLVHEIRDYLTKESDDWRHYPINLITNQIVDEQSLLTAIAQGAAPKAIANFIPKSDSDSQTSNNPQQDARNIIDTITESLQVGSIVFFELNDWDALGENQDSLLSWFMEYFWIPLTKKQSQLSQDYANIRIILFMTTCSSLSKKCLNLPHFCTPSKFNHQKACKLSLHKKWKLEDICKWIEDTYKYPRVKSLRESTTIFNLSQGDPAKTCLILQRKFNLIS